MLGELLFFCIYVLQQLGIMLGVGAQTLLLCTHLVALHRHEAAGEQASFNRAARMALGSGLVLIVVSGLGAVAVHTTGGQSDILFAPAFLFKWVLIVFVLAVYLGHKRLAPWNNLVAWFGGGSWYALFLVHTLAPVTSWFNLLGLYAAWMIFFAAVWAGFVLLMHGSKMPSVHLALPKLPKAPTLPTIKLPKIQLPKPALATPMPAPKPKVVAPLPPPKPQPAPLPVIAVKPPPLPSVLLMKEGPLIPKPAPAPTPQKPTEIESMLPAMRIMPKRVEDLKLGRH